MNSLLCKNFTASGAIAPRRIVKITAVSTVAQGAAPTDKLMGVSAELTAADGQRIDVHQSGIVDVDYGGTVGFGDPLTSDANGKAVVAAPAAGVNNRIIGFAQIDGADGDIGSVKLAPGFMQGAGLA
ncbi:MAG: DUF2190 family protein [Alphaproteobacteria bacterium]|nr:DUF2190 family protein [Alphaproteobacteria bacterium]